MNIQLTIKFCFIFLLPVIAFTQVKEKQSLNSGWQFILNDDPKLSVSFAKWQKINLPHTWNAKDIIDDTVGYHQGIGWYRKEITLPQLYSQKHLELFFEGACNRTEVFINGIKAGEHNGGFTGFRINLDDKFLAGKRNEILVKVDNGKYLQDSIPPFSGDFNLMGGIYRDVWLIATNKIYFSGAFGSTGILFKPEVVTDQKASFSIQTSLSDANHLPAGYVSYQLFFDKTLVASGTNQEKRNKVITKGINGFINDPKLWSPETPNLYTLLVQFKNENEEVIDEVSQNIGFKWASISDKKEFLLNGKPYKLKGASRHQDYKNIGNAVTDATHIRDIQLMKEMGCNFIRIAHYPQDPAIYEACDKLGLIVWSEIPVVDRVVNNTTFLGSSQTMMQEMVLQNFNHPSVAIWGYHNEVRNLDNVSVANAKSLDSISHHLDPARLTAMAFESNMELPYFKSNPLLKEMLNIASINGFNVYQGWYRGSYQNISAFLDTLYSFNPSKPIMLSEYGAGSMINIHTSNPSIFDFSEEYQCAFHEAYVKAGNTKPWMIGFGIWNLIDFQRDGREDVSPNINNKGMVTTDRQPKDVYYYYKSQWSKQPFVYISGKNWKERFAFFSTVYDHASVITDIVVYSNQQKIKLYCNGKPASLKSTDEGKFVFSVSMIEGNNYLHCNSIDDRLTDAMMVRYKFISTSTFSKKFPGDYLCFDVGQTRSYFTDPISHEQWIPDKKYVNETWGYMDGSVWNSWPNTAWNGVREGIHKPIANTDNETLFQTFVEGLTAWKANIPDGRYRITILLCEPFTAAQRKDEERIMNISVNGQDWQTGLNLEKEFGVYTAAIFDKEITIQNNSGIEINFKAFSGKTILNGVRIQKL